MATIMTIGLPSQTKFVAFVLFCYFFVLLFSFSVSLDNALNNVENAKYARGNIARPLSAVMIGLESNALR